VIHHTELFIRDGWLSGTRRWGWQCFNRDCRAPSASRTRPAQEAQVAADAHEQLTLGNDETDQEPQP
jgi:hypothetical protein